MLKRVWDTSSDIFMSLRRMIAATASVRFCGFVCLCCLLASASAQREGLHDPNPLGVELIPYDNAGGAVIVVTVFADNGRSRLDRQSLVRLFNKKTQTSVWETTTDRSEAVFGNLSMEATRSK